MVRRVLLGFAAVALAGGFLFLEAAPAAATVNPADKCHGTGDFVKSGHHYTAADSGVDVVPKTDDVNWAGQIDIPATESPYSGHIDVELPPPFGKLTIDTWKGSSDSVQNSGTKHYDLPSLVPANVEFEVSGAHTQGGITCSGTVKVKIDGSSLGPFSIASLVGTVLTGGLFAMAGRAKVGG